MNLAVTVESVIDLDASTTIGLGFSCECHFPCLQCDVVGTGHKAGIISTKDRC
jgi:hypothetical protein